MNNRLLLPKPVAEYPIVDIANLSYDNLFYGTGFREDYTFFFDQSKDVMFFSDRYGDRVQSFGFIGTTLDLTMYYENDIILEAQYIVLSPDASKLFVYRLWETGDISEYTYNSAYNRYDLTTVHTLGSYAAAYCIDFGDNGNLIYIEAGSPWRLEIFQLNSPYTFASGGATVGDFELDNIAWPDGSVYNFRFSPNGLQMFSINRVTEEIYQCDLTTPWDLNTMSFTKARSVTAELENGFDDVIAIHWNYLMTKFYMYTEGGIYQYSI